jgi:hypothetical protein
VRGRGEGGEGGRGAGDAAAPGNKMDTLN